MLRVIVKRWGSEKAKQSLLQMEKPKEKQMAKLMQTETVKEILTD